MRRSRTLESSTMMVFAMVISKSLFNMPSSITLSIAFNAQANAMEDALDVQNSYSLTTISIWNLAISITASFSQECMTWSGTKSIMDLTKLIAVGGLTRHWIAFNIFDSIASTPLANELLG